MQFLDIFAQLGSLPSTYLRPGTPFSFLQNAKTAGLFMYANASDGLIQQIQSFAGASGVWLDAWGNLFGVLRNPNEVDDVYMNRISAILTAGRGTPVAIEIFILVSLGLNATVVEDLIHCAWSLSLTTELSQTAFQQLISDLVFVRPAGVPFLSVAVTQQGGLYPGSVDYLDAPRVTGAYLKTPQQSANAVELSAYTNNAIPLLPTTFLTDPTLNPGLTG